MNKKRTWEKLSSLSAKILKDPRSSKIQKKLAWWVLSQSSTDKQTWKEMEAIASFVLNSDKYSDVTKSLAGTLVSQSYKNR